MKKLLLVLAYIFLTFSSCEKAECVTCIVQSRADKKIVESRTECDRSSSFRSGFVDGIKKRYEDQNADVDIICN
ncbi:hypothetical protein [Larkinella arboricola]|uniref:hypothetical protein n=1 Tax=Larkinella arboricola TaxID=643671 RepID=UPI0011BA62DF|nr:hypothetical protein [Larkinella arboricola]